RRQVRDAYTAYLRTTPDDGTLDVLTAQLSAGKTLEQVKAQILGSDQYFLAVAGLSNHAFLQNLYPDSLGRPLDAGGQQWFGAQLANGATRESVALQVLTS